MATYSIIDDRDNKGMMIETFEADDIDEANDYLNKFYNGYDAKIILLKCYENSSTGDEDASSN